MKNVASQSPDNDDRESADEGPGRSEDGGSFPGRDSEGVPNPTKNVPLIRFCCWLCVVGFLGNNNYWIA
jgi:hypothetical protein